MQRSLFLVRHALALDSSPGQKDFDRELSSVGRANLARMGRRLYSMYPNPERIVSSPAARASDSAYILAEQLHFDTDKVQLIDEIYEASVRSLVALINELDPALKSVMIIGHNPALSYLAEYLTGAEVGTIAPGGVVLMYVERIDWDQVSEGNCKFVQHHEPED